MYLEKEIFETVIESTPLISVDLVVKSSEGKYLLGYRTNKPAKGAWFVPGGRIFKNERIDDAFTRLCQNELGLSFSRKQAHFLGAYEHFYDDCVFGEHISTHYVVLGYEIIVDISIEGLPNEQHNQYQWFTLEELLLHDNVHKHSKWYLADT